MIEQLKDLMLGLRDLLVERPIEYYAKMHELCVANGFSGYGSGQDENGEFIVLTIADPKGYDNDYRDQIDVIVHLQRRNP